MKSNIDKVFGILTEMGPQITDSQRIINLIRSIGAIMRPCRQIRSDPQCLGSAIDELRETYGRRTHVGATINKIYNILGKGKQSPLGFIEYGLLVGELYYFSDEVYPEHRGVVEKLIDFGSFFTFMPEHDLVYRDLLPFVEALSMC